MFSTGRKILIWTVLACFAVFFGVDLATQGIEEIHGPLPTPQIEKNSEQTDLELEVAKLQQQIEQMEKETKVAEVQEEPPNIAANPNEKAPIPGPGGDTLVNRMADSAGMLLRGTAQRGVEMFVSLFDGILE